MINNPNTQRDKFANLKILLVAYCNVFICNAVICVINQSNENADTEAKLIQGVDLV